MDGKLTSYHIGTNI